MAFFFVWATGRVSPLALAVSNVCFCVNCFYYTLTIVLWHALCTLLLFRRWRSGAWRRIRLI